ncbi:MAG TPA: MarR family winged helix-turn-helix transcriptional regulator [Candidatus Dormibacteraeota bacterium]|nr:MarR family winged helix-turn-helix transcriptional regulator [Candidatus Dormibacteraeota bacterium]
MNRSQTDPLRAWPTWALIPLAGRKAEQGWAAYLSGRGITPAGYGILVELGSRQACQADLAAQRRVGPQSLGRTVDRLERAGLVTRERGHLDRRLLLVRRTEAGHRLVADVARRISESEGLLVERLPDSRQFRADLLAVIAILETPRPPATDSSSREVTTRRGRDGTPGAGG